jgi:alpha-beta hydrolase superfamily lysophospholipase
MKEIEFRFDAKDGEKIFVRKWLPENEIKCILQISHGMAEHSPRYREFGEYLTQRGIAVYINDHRGHGQTAKSLEEVGFFAPKKGWELVVSDIHELTKIIAKENPNKPVFIFGHSMGSLALRANLMKYENLYYGAIISGTNAKKGALVQVGRTISLLQGFFKGKRKSSKFMTGLSFKGFNTPFKPLKTPFDWLSRDEERNKNYWDDPYCGTVFSNRFFYDMLTMINFINCKKSLENLPKELPLLFISGKMDPVGSFGVEAPIVYNKYKELGVKDIEIKMYENARHEMLNEINRKEVFEDIFNWIEKHIKK